MLRVGHNENTVSLFSNEQSYNLLRQVEKNPSAAQLITQPRLLFRTLSCNEATQSFEIQDCC